MVLYSDFVLVHFASEYIYILFIDLISSHLLPFYKTMSASFSTAFGSWLWT